MKNNMGALDRGIRFVLAIIISILYATEVIPNNEWWSYVLLVIAGLFVITSLLGFCPFYYLFKIDSRSYEKKKKEREQ